MTPRRGRAGSSRVASFRKARSRRRNRARIAAAIPARGPAALCSAARSWAVGDRLRHAAFGEGHITHLFGSGEKVSIAVKFEGMGPKILDPRLAPIEPIPGAGP